MPLRKRTPLRKVASFLDRLPLRQAQLRADLLAGLTVALVLLPQSMAYAQPAGLPPYFGLYAAFLPVPIGANLQDQGAGAAGLAAALR